MSSDATPSQPDPLRAVQHIGRQWHQVQQHWQQHVVTALHTVQAAVHDATHPLAAHAQRYAVCLDSVRASTHPTA